MKKALSIVRVIIHVSLYALAAGLISHFIIKTFHHFFN